MPIIPMNTHKKHHTEPNTSLLVKNSNLLKKSFKFLKRDNSSKKFDVKTT